MEDRVDELDNSLEHSLLFFILHRTLVVGSAALLLGNIPTALGDFRPQDLVVPVPL